MSTPALVSPSEASTAVRFLSDSVRLVTDAKLVLGTFQAVIAAELDGPRTRDLAVHLIGR